MKNQVYRMSLLYDFYGDMLTEKQRDVVELYYNDDLSLSEIAENEGITRQGVRDSIKRAEAQLLEMEDRLHLARRFREMREGIAAIRKAAGDCVMPREGIFVKVLTPGEAKAGDIVKVI